MRLLIALLLAPLVASGGIRTAPCTLEAAPGEWAAVLTYPADLTQPVTLSVTAHDFDTAGEATITVNGTAIPDVLPATVASADNVDVTVVYQLPPGAAVAAAVNRIVFGWPRDLSRVPPRPAGSSYQVVGCEMSYTEAAPVQVQIECRRTWRAGVHGEWLGRSIWGCKRSDTLERTTWYRTETETLTHALLYMRDVLMFKDIPPQPMSDALPGDVCDAAYLWAEDEGARAPEMTRAVKIQRACAQ